MTRAQRKTAERLERMIPGASWGLDLYSMHPEGDLLYDDGSVLVHFSRPRRSEELDPLGRRKIVGWDHVGHARIGRGGYVVDAMLRAGGFA